MKVFKETCEYAKQKGMLVIADIKRGDIGSTAQGGKAEDIALGFDNKGLGGIINASRSLMCAYKSDRWKNQFNETEYAQATRTEALRMKEELNKAIQGGR